MVNEIVSETVICQRCKAVNSLEREECGICGNILKSSSEFTSPNLNEFRKILCPSCNSVNKSTNIVCGVCGIELKSNIKKPKVVKKSFFYRDIPIELGILVVVNYIGLFLLFIIEIPSQWNSALNEISFFLFLIIIFLLVYFLQRGNNTARILYIFWAVYGIAILNKVVNVFLILPLFLEILLLTLDPRIIKYCNNKKKSKFHY